MNGEIIFALRNYFERLREYSKLDRWNAFYITLNMLQGFLRGIYYAGVIDESCYDRLFEISSKMIVTFGE